VVSNGGQAPVLLILAQFRLKQRAHGQHASGMVGQKTTFVGTTQSSPSGLLRA
jgi:hypothetical protein